MITIKAISIHEFIAPQKFIINTIAHASDLLFMLILDSRNFQVSKYCLQMLPRHVLWQILWCFVISVSNTFYSFLQQFQRSCFWLLHPMQHYSAIYDPKQQMLTITKPILLKFNQDEYPNFIYTGIVNKVNTLTSYILEYLTRWIP